MKKKKNQLVEKFDAERVKEIILQSTKENFGADRIIKEMGDKHLPAYREGKIEDIDISDDITKISRALSLESGHALVESVESKYNGFALEMRKELEKEFDCKTASEKALVNQSVNAHLRGLTFSRYLVANQKSINSDLNNYFRFLSKEIDRTHRQFISAIETLKFIKQPSLKVNVKTNTAFFADKQQFNNNSKNNESK